MAPRKNQRVAKFVKPLMQGAVCDKHCQTDNIEGLHTIKVESFLLRTDILPKRVASIKCASHSVSLLFEPSQLLILGGTVEPGYSERKASQRLNLAS